LIYLYHSNFFLQLQVLSSKMQNFIAIRIDFEYLICYNARKANNICRTEGSAMKCGFYEKIICIVVVVMLAVSVLQALQLKQIRRDVAEQKTQYLEIQAERAELLRFAGLENTTADA